MRPWAHRCGERRILPAAPQISVLLVGWYAVDMNLTIELDREEDGRWIADIPELNVLLYGSDRDEAIRLAEETARELIADRISRGELPQNAANPVFAVAA